MNGKRIRKGEPVFVEVTGQVRRYIAPVMGTVIVGTPSRRQEQLAEAAAKTLEVICVMARPGIEAQEVAHAAAEVLREFLPELHFHNNYGYTVGIGYPPSWLEDLGFFLQDGNRTTLQAGMTLHLPISLRKYGEYGINLSHTIVVTDSGGEKLTGRAGVFLKP